MAIQQKDDHLAGWSWRTPPAGGWDRIRARIDRPAESAGTMVLVWCATGMALIAPFLAWHATTQPDISAVIVQQAQLLERGRQNWVRLDAAEPDAPVHFYLALPVNAEAFGER